MGSYNKLVHQQLMQLCLVLVILFQPLKTFKVEFLQSLFAGVFRKMETEQEDKAFQFPILKICTLARLLKNTSMIEILENAKEGFQ